jgi:F-type H+-transporting ATPase subunit b
MLDISPIVMLIEAGIFLVTLILLNQWLFQPLLSHMEDRDKQLDDILKNASSNTNEVKKYEEEIAAILENAKSEANKIKKLASEEAKKEALSMVESAVSKIEAKKTAFYAELEAKKSELSNLLEGDSVELKSMLSTKLKGIAS